MNKDNINTSKNKMVFSNKKKFILLSAILLVIIIIIIICVHLFKKDIYVGIDEPITDVYPEDVEGLYNMMVGVSCTGDLYFDIKLDSGKNMIDSIDTKGLLDYLFSYLDKNNLLSDKMDAKLISDEASKLLYGESNLIDNIQKYQYGNYIYDVNGNKIIRSESKCSNEKIYVTQLYGYSYNDLELSMDVNIGYLNSNVLYTLDGNKLGSYSGDKTELDTLFTTNSYYRYNFVKNDGIYKLSSVELVSKK